MSNSQTDNLTQSNELFSYLTASIILNFLEDTNSSWAHIYYLFFTSVSWNVKDKLLTLELSHGPE